MALLPSLVRSYDRLAARHEIAPFRYSAEEIDFVVSLNPDGTPNWPIDLRRGEGKKRPGRSLYVPASFKRPGTVPRSFFLWDNTAFVLGVTKSEGKDARARYATFQARHRKDLAGTDDEGLQALLRFLDVWTPEHFAEKTWPEDMMDKNVVFALESERRDDIFLHDRPVARELWAKLSASADSAEAACLVTGNVGPVARLHPAIKGVWGAQTSGASLVAFNAPAFESYGHAQGDNAPMSQAAAEAYGAVLNKFLERDSHHRLQIGDASTVFWAEAPNPALAQEAEGAFEAMFATVPSAQNSSADEAEEPEEISFEEVSTGRAIDERVEAGNVRALLERLRHGRLIAKLRPELSEGVRFFVLGLAPNAARLSIRFYVEDDFGQIADRYGEFMQAMRLVPAPKDANPSIWRLLIETAVLRKSENIPPNLAGEWLRTILEGGRYPLSLRATLLMRLRADKDVNGLRVAMLKAVEISHLPKPRRHEVPVSLDPANKDPGYLLGRLFATYEFAQTQALGSSVNATIRDQYYGTASATPRAVFPVLQRKATHHLSRLRKDRPGVAVVLDRKLGEIFEVVAPEELFVPVLTARRQALFAVGYYHQRNEFYRRKDGGTPLSDAEQNQEPAT